MPKIHLPSVEAGDALWPGAPPDPLDDPDLYEGLTWRRVVAYGLDVLAIMTLLGGLWMVLMFFAVLSFGLLLPLKLVVLSLTPLAYHTLFIGHGGATPGMRLLDVEVRTWTGGRPHFLEAFLMTVLFYATVLPTSWLILLAALFNDRRRTLHDFLSGTLCVRHSRLAEGSPLPA